MKAELFGLEEKFNANCIKCKNLLAILECDLQFGTYRFICLEYCGIKLKS